MKTQRILACVLVMFLFLAIPAFAQSSTTTQDANTWGDISVMYFGAQSDTGISGAQPFFFGAPWFWASAVAPAMGSRSANGWYADANLYFAKRWGVGIDYNSNNINMGTFAFNNVPIYNVNNNQIAFANNVVVNVGDFTLGEFTGKVKYQLTDPANKDGALRVYLLWRSYNWSWMNAGYNPSGLGGGIDGFFKMGDRWEGFGMLDYASCDGNVLGWSLNTSSWRYEVGVKYYFSQGFFGRASYRGENMHFNRSPWSDATLNGPTIGIGVKF